MADPFHEDPLPWPFPRQKSNPPPRTIGEANLNTAILWILAERKGQMGRWSEAHDDQHTDQDWWVLLAKMALEDDYPHQRKLVRVAATALAALEAHIRFQQSMRAPGVQDDNSGDDSGVAQGL